MNEWVEWIGYAASFMIATSLLLTDLKKLRVINTIGCVLFVIYGSLVGAYPVVISNIAIAFINFYHLYKLSKSNKGK